jgi:hypothetical protein
VKPNLDSLVLPAATGEASAVVPEATEAAHLEASTLDMAQAVVLLVVEVASYISPTFVFPLSLSIVHVLTRVAPLQRGMAGSEGPVQASR